MAGVKFDNNGGVDVDIDITELEQLRAKLGTLISIVDKPSMEDLGKTLKTFAQARTPVGWRWDKSSHSWKESPQVTGDYLKSESQWTDIKATATSMTFGVKAPYAFIIERGGYPTPQGSPPKGKPWAKGWRVSGGYSRQAPGGIFGPMIEDQPSPLTRGATFKDALKEFEEILNHNLQRLLGE